MMEKYVAKYLRISDDDRDIDNIKEESISISNQRIVLQNFVNHHEELSMYPVKEFLDDGYSGVNFNRPGIKEVLREVREGNVYAIVVKDLSRFGRNYIEVGDYIEQIFPFMGVRFISISDNYDSFKNQAGIEIGLKNLIHDLYSRDLSKKIKSVKRLRQNEGVYNGGDVPYGYRRSNKKGENYCPDPMAAEVVKDIFRLALEGREPAYIAKYLNQKGICTPGVYKNQAGIGNYHLKNEKKNMWTPVQVRAIIQNEVYLGTYICHKISSIRPRESAYNEEKDYIKHVNAHDALISKEDFETAQKAIHKRKKRGKYTKGQNPYALTGKVKCGYCGYSMSLNRNVNNRFFYCRMGESCGSHLKIETDILEEVILKILNQLLVIYVEYMKIQEEERKHCLSELEKLRKKLWVSEMAIEHLKSSRLMLYRDWKEEKISKEEYIFKKNELAKKETECQKQKMMLDDRIKELLIRMDENVEKVDLQPYYGVKELTKELVDNLIERIDVYDGDRIEIRWKFQGEFEKWISRKMFKAI